MIVADSFTLLFKDKILVIFYNRGMKKSIPKTLLVVKNRALGDSLMGLSTLQYLKDTLPETTIIYAVPKWIFPLYKNTQTAAHKVIALDFKTKSDWLESRRTIKKLNVDSVMELFQSGRTAKFFKLWRLFGGPRYHFHNHHQRKGPVHDQGIIKSNIQRDLDGAWTFFGHGTQPPNFLGYTPALLTKESSKKNQIVLGVVATRETKMWPLASYGKLTHLIQEKYPDTLIVIPLGPGDKIIEDELKNIISSNTEFLKVPLDLLPVELSGSLQYVGNDTGLKHLCVSLDVPTFTLFGPEPPTEWHPYDPVSHPFYFREPLECRTKSAHYCGLQTCDSMICLNQLSPEDLLKKISGVPKTL
jgi:heptosyltransferase-2